MAYATIQDAKDRNGDDYVVRSVDRDGDGQVDTTALDAALASASALVDSYLGKVLDVPLANPSEQVVWITVDIALYRTSADPDPYSEEKRKRYEDAIAWLEAVAAGGLNPGDNVDNPVPPVGGGAKVRANQRVFTRDSLRGVL